MDENNLPVSGKDIEDSSFEIWIYQKAFELNGNKNKGVYRVIES
jgi:hypothetical protein